MPTFFEELTCCVGFDAADEQRLRALHPVLEPQFAAIAAEIHDAVHAHPGAAAILGQPGRAAAFRDTVIEWMSTGLLGPWDEAFFAKRGRIGHRHVDVGVPQHCVVTAMSVLRMAYFDRIAASHPADTAYAIIRSVNKLLDLELATMQHGYQVDSERRLVERERRQQLQRLLAMRTLSSGLAHELRNPLNSAKLQLELLERRLRRQLDDARLAEPTAHARHEIERLTALVTDFLAFAEPPPLAAEVQDVVAIVEHVVELERPLAELRGVDITVVAHPTNLVARIDPGKVHQIVHNLITNAIEAVPVGGSVDVRITAEHDRVHVCVDDNGPGIPDHVRARMFEPFFSTKDCGTGLGMSIVHSLVAMHGGTIDVASTPAGTRCDVALPRAA